jgi:hypothetical protein
MPFKRVVTDDEADLQILALASEKRKFAIPVAMPLPDHLQFALERGMENDWFRLIDVAAVAELPDRLMRIFRLTDTGMARMAELAKSKAAA